MCHSISNWILTNHTDCLYLDMNGIIHTCAANTGQGSVRKVNETDMVQNIFKVSLDILDMVDFLTTTISTLNFSSRKLDLARHSSWPLTVLLLVPR